jgi:hypothetical protein
LYIALPVPSTATTFPIGNRLDAIIAAMRAQVCSAWQTGTDDRYVSRCQQRRMQSDPHRDAFSEDRAQAGIESTGRRCARDGRAHTESLVGRDSDKHSGRGIG